MIHLKKFVHLLSFKPEARVLSCLAMPRSKNPNPHQVNRPDGSEQLTGSDGEENDQEELSESLSPPNLDLGEPENGGSTQNEDPSLEAAAVPPTEPELQKSIKKEPLSEVEAGEDLQVDIRDPDVPTEAENDNGQSVEKSPMSNGKQTPTNGRKKTFPSLGHHNPEILEWFRRRFTLREGTNKSASQVIRQYEKDFPNASRFPLHNFQVGHFLRRVFPNLERCKITWRGKRTWVYRHLSIISDVIDWRAQEENSGSGGDSLKGKRVTDARSDVRRSSRVRRIKSFDNDYDCSVDEKSLLYPPRDDGKSPDKTDVSKKPVNHVEKKAARDDNIMHWLRENYEYAEGYYVRSLDVMRRYNEGMHSFAHYLSQVGRFIKSVFPKARHMRKTMKGGKREWVYENIRSKKYDKEPPPQKLPSSSYSSFSARPSLVPIKSMTDNFPSSSERQNPADAGLSNFTSELSSVYLQNGDENKMDDTVTSSHHPISASSRLLSLASTTTNRISSQKSIQWHNATPVTSNSASKDPKRRSHLESHIDRLRNTREGSDPGPRRMTSPLNKSPQTLNVSTKSQIMPQVGRIWSIKTAVPIDGNKSVSVIQHGVAGKRKLSLSSGDGPPAKINIIKLDKNGHVKSIEKGLRSRSFEADPNKTSSSFTMDTYQVHNEKLLLKPNTPVKTQPSQRESLQWSELQNFKSHQSGWAATPVKPKQLNTDFYEWVLFEGDSLCNGSRIFRELRIYDDWSVSIHVMGRKVYADEVGGITDLKRSWDSVNKVMETLAEAKLCRGFASSRLSEMRVHGVIVAKPEIWSKRNIDSEELRHRAINCQVLHRLDGVCCAKCSRINLLNRQKATPKAVRSGEVKA